MTGAQPDAIGDTPLANGAAEPKGMATYRLARALCAPVFLMPVPALIAGAGWYLSISIVADVFGVLTFLMLVFSPLLAIGGLVTCLVAGSRGQLSDEVDRKMWRLFMMTGIVLAVLYSIGRNGFA